MVKTDGRSAVVSRPLPVVTVEEPNARRGADDLQNPGVGVDTLAEAVQSKTNTLARGLRGHAEETVCTCGWKPTNDRFSHDDGCPAEDEWLPVEPEGLSW